MNEATNITAIPTPNGVYVGTWIGNTVTLTNCGCTQNTFTTDLTIDGSDIPVLVKVLNGVAVVRVQQKFNRYAR